MTSIVLALEVVAPLCIMMLIGYGIRKAQWVDEHSLNVMNRLVFKIFLPILVFMNVYRLNLEEIKSGKILDLVLMIWLIILFVIFASLILLKIKVPDIKRRTVMTQGIFRSNLVLFGLPVATSIYGTENTTTITLLIATVIPAFNILSVILLERTRKAKVEIKDLIISILKNPFIIVSILGVILILFDIKIPSFLESPLNSISKVGTPLAFIILGATLNFKSLTKNWKALFVVAVGKLILVPSLTFTLAYCLGFGQEVIVAIIGAMASPTAVSSFSMAKALDIEGELAGQIVVVTTVSSIVTLFFWIAGLKMAGLI